MAQGNVPLTYARSGGGITANFNAVDIIEGKAYQVMYGGNPDASSAYLLRSYTYDSCVGNTTTDPIGGAWTYQASSSPPAIDVNFDTTLGKTMQIDNGEIIVNGTAKAAAAFDEDFNVIANVYEVNNGTENFICSGASIQYSAVNGSEHRFGISMPVTKRNIKKGNKLRLNIILWNLSAHPVYLFHQPGTAGVGGILTGTLPATLKMWIPFNIGGIYG